MYRLWLKRCLLSVKYIFQFSSLFSFLSLILGIASLTLALLFINGFSLGLEKAIVDMSGHVMIRLKEERHKQEVLDGLKPYQSSFKQTSLFLSSEALALQSGQFQPLIVEGIEDKTFSKSEFLKNRILEQDFQSSENSLLIGQALAKKLDVQVGSSLNLVIFKNSESYFSKKKKKFQVEALVDFGRYDFNSRYVISKLSELQKIENKMDKVSGIRLWLHDGERADSLAFLMSQNLDDNYEVYSWRDLDKNLLEIIEMDKKIIFFVLFILILAAGFNVSSSLFVQVFQKTKDIAILKSMGAKPSLIRNLFILQALVLGVIGILLGIGLGWCLAFLLMRFQNYFGFIPQEIYQINQIVLKWKTSDMIFIFSSSLFIVILSSLLPARRAYKLKIKDALSYE